MNGEGVIATPTDTPLSIPEGRFLIAPEEFETYPFYRQVWDGGAALVLYLLEQPQEVRGKRVADVGTGNGIVARMCVLCGAEEVMANDRDAGGFEEMHRTMPEVMTWCQDVREFADIPYPAQVVTAGDVMYSPETRDAFMTAFTIWRRNGARILVGDPGRPHFPWQSFQKIAEYPPGNVWVMK